MSLRGMAQTHVDKLAERFKRLIVGQAGNANTQLRGLFVIRAESSELIQQPKLR